MKQLFTLLVLAIISVTTVNGQLKYQKEKGYHAFIAGAAAIGGMDLFKSIKNWQGKDIWSAGEVGIVNKNTSMGIAVTSYEYNKAKENYIGFVLQRRLFYMSRFETWLSVSSSIPFEGDRPFKFQPQIRERVHLNKVVAIELAYGKVLSKSLNYSLADHQAIHFGVNISFHGNVNTEY